jgi:hypothetical protein
MTSALRVVIVEYRHINWVECHVLKPDGFGIELFEDLQETSEIMRVCWYGQPKDIPFRIDVDSAFVSFIPFLFLLKALRYVDTWHMYPVELLRHTTCLNADA